ncbi:MAG: polyprenyl synthetase family protein [Bacteroidaceae bacterium]|nr:polyprenyl synthetase family protein [Bacteroidaceae bacterium]
MDALQQIRKPIEAEMGKYKEVFDSYLVNPTPTLREVLATIAQRRGKMMRPMLTLLTAKLVGGEANDKSIYTAATFEFFHTASLVHDDVVDESEERRGQESVNSAYGNQIAVLVGDFILANALLCAAKTGSSRLIEIVSKAAQELACGELLQLDNIKNQAIDETVYFDIIKSKTAALFAACAESGVLSVSSDENLQKALRDFGEYVGICFQIRDDIFDYHHDPSIGKPTGNDMKEGKLTLPVIHAVLAAGNEEMLALAQKVKNRDVTQDEIDVLVDFTVKNGGIDYAEKTMNDYAEKAKSLLAPFPSSEVKQALFAYVDYVIDRSL